jgi:hypothetical protein
VVIPDTVSGSGATLVFTVTEHDHYSTRSCSHSLIWPWSYEFRPRCPAPLQGAAGTVLDLGYEIENRAPGPRGFAWMVAGERTWLNHPLSGYVSVAGVARRSLRVPLAIPDSAASGSMRLTFIVLGGGRTADCSHEIQILPRSQDTASELALVALQPNPAVGGFTVAFTLAQGPPAQIEVFDLRGRRMCAHELSGLDPGLHVVSLADTRDLPSGVYLLRLVQGSRVMTTRGILIK